MKVICNNNLINAIHFCGKSFESFPKSINIILDNIKLNKIDDSKLTLLSCWTDDNDCILYEQLKANDIILHNCLPNNYDKSSKWYMPYKIHYILSYLINEVKTDIVMILDGYDVLMVSTDLIIEKFLNQPYRIMFNATINNYPNVTIDNIYNRDKLPPQRYFNAGCCIGFRKDLIEFYSKALNYFWMPNKYNSEQYILRYVFKDYLESNDKYGVMIDYASYFFRTMSRTKVSLLENESLMFLSDVVDDNPIPEYKN